MRTHNIPSGVRAIEVLLYLGAREVINYINTFHNMGIQIKYTYMGNKIGKYLCTMD